MSFDGQSDALQASRLFPDRRFWITSSLPTILPRSLAETCSILSIPGANRIQELLRVVANPVLEDDFDVLNVRNSL